MRQQIIVIAVAVIIVLIIISMVIEHYFGSQKRTFERWPSRIHYEPEQVQRIIRAQKQDVAKGILAIDKKNQIIVIQGARTSPYISTPISCTCPDFANRHLPCKHMYRLAIELKELQTAVGYAGRHGSFDPNSDIQRYQELYNLGTITKETYDRLTRVLEDADEYEHDQDYL